MDRLQATVQNYGWGDTAFIPELQGRRAAHTPEAELWMGAHPKGPSVLVSTGQSLADHIAEDLSASLGEAARFGGLPFLFKVLAAAQPLSIQTHPDSAQARAGFDRENALGLAFDDPTRTYRDPHHKPELVCALTPFDAKCGFRPVAESVELIAYLDQADLRPLLERLSQVGDDGEVLHDVLVWLLSLQPESASRLTTSLAEACVFAADGPWLTEIAWTHRLQALHPGDPGVVVALLLNHFTLEPGEALFLDAGVLHCYLQGAAVEIMANSDTVVRGGLTTKHVDTTELAKIVDPTPRPPAVQRPVESVHTYSSSAPEFELSRIVLDGGYMAPVEGPEILLATEGSFKLATSDAQLAVQPGEPIWMDAADGHWAIKGTGTLFRATVPAPTALGRQGP